MFRKKYEDSVMFNTPSKNVNNYDFFNSLYEKTFNTKDEEDNEEFDLNSKLDSLAIKPDDFDDVFGAMYRDAENDLGISKEKYVNQPYNQTEKAYAEKIANNKLLVPNKQAQTQDTSAGKEDEKKPLHKSIPILSDAIGGVIGGIGGAGKTFGEWDYKLDVAKANSYKEKAEKAKAKGDNEKAEKYLKKYEEQMAKAEYWRQNSSDTADKIMDYGDSYSTVKEDAGMLEKATKGAVGSLANMAVGTVIGGGQPLVGMGVTTYGQGKKEAQDLNLSDEDADRFAISNAIIETGSELLLPGAKGLKSFLTTGSIKTAIKEAGKEGVGGFLKEISKEFGQEGLTEVANIANEFRFKDKDGNSIAVNGGDFSSLEAGLKTIMEAGERTLTAGLSGAIMGGLTQGGANIANHGQGTSSNTQQAQQQAQPELKGFLKDEISTKNNVDNSSPETVINTGSKAVDDINNALGFNALEEADLQPVNPDAPYIEKTVNENGQEVYITEDGNTVNAKLAEMVAQQNGTPIESLAKFTPEQAEIRRVNQEADTTIEAIETSIQEQGTEATIKTLENSLKNGEITQEIFNTATEYVNAIANGTQQEATQVNSIQHDLTQNNTTTPDIAQNKGIKNNISQQELTQVNTNQHELTQNDTNIDEKVNKSKTVEEQEKAIRQSEYDSYVKELKAKQQGDIKKKGKINKKLWDSLTESEKLIYNENSKRIDSLMSSIDVYPFQKQKDALKAYVKIAVPSDTLMVDTKNNTVSKVAENTENTSSETVEGANKEYLDKVEKLNKVVNGKDFKVVFSNLKLEVIEKLTVKQDAVNQLGKAIGREVIFFKANSKNAPNGFMKNNIIFLNGDYSGSAMTQVLGHETFHTLKTTNKETFNKLVEYGKENFTAEEITQFLSKIDNEAEVKRLKNNPDLLSEEMLAEAFGNDFANKDFWKGLEKNNKTLFEKIKDVIAKIFNRAKSYKTDFLTQKHINELRVEFEGIFGDLTKEITDNKTNIDNNVKFSTRKGKEFDEWFKGSVMTKADGKPQLFYHTTNAKFDDFDDNAKTINGKRYGAGHYFTDKRPQPGYGYGKNRLSVNLKIENPLDFSKKIDIDKAKNIARDLDKEFGATKYGEYRTEKLEKTIKSFGENGEIPVSFFSGAIQIENSDYRDILRKYGYDGIIEYSGGEHYVVAFSNDQVNIKSRVDEDGVKFSTRQTETEEFKKWFKDSKVVDENGKPLVVYHGTTAGIKFNKFNSNKKGKNTDNIIGYVGFNFTENTNTASAYADNELRIYNPEYHKNARVYPVYLSIQNPLIYGVNMDFSKVFDKNEISNLKEKESQFSEKASELYKKRDKTKNKEEKEEFGRLAKEATKESMRYQNINWAISSGNPVALFEMHASNYYREKIDGKELEYAEKIQKKLIDLGYDGIILENTKLDSPSSLLHSQFATHDANVPNELKEQDFINQYIAFYPNQIKSAIGNNGNFDPNNDDIRFSTRSKEETAKITAPLYKVKDKTNNLQLRAGIKKLQGVKVDTNINLIDVFEEAIRTMSNNTESVNANAKTFSKILKGQGIETKQANAIAKYFANVVEASKINVMESTPKAKNVITSSSYKAKNKGGVKKQAGEAFDKFYSRIVDSTNAGKLVNDVFYTKARISKNSFSISEHIMTEGLVDKNGKTVGKSIKELFADTIPEGKEVKFMEYALHKHNISRALQGKYIFFKEDGTPIHSNESAKIVKEMEAKNPDFANRQAELTGWINQFMKVWAVDTGLMSEDFHSMLKEMYNHYVPTNRSFQDHEELFGGGYGGKGFVDKSKPTKRAQQGGSSRDIIDLQESIVNLATKTVRTAKMNEVGQELVKAVRQNPAMSNLASIVAKPDNNVDNVVRVLDNGEPVYVEIHNKQLLEMIEQIHSPEYGALTEVVKKFNGGVKALITSKNPLFAITNTLRDYQTYMINSTEGNVFKRWSNVRKAINLIAKELKNQDISNTEYGLFKAMGISGSGIMAKDNSKTLSNITGKKAVVNKQTGAIEGYKEFGKIKKGWNKFNEGLEILTSSTETAFRLAEFLGAIERGESVEDATLKAMEITVDFARGGDITKSVDAYVKYLNAGVQGLDRLARQVKNHPVQTLTRSIAHIAAPALVLAAFNAGDDEYEMLDDRTKDNNFLIPLKLFGGEEGQYLKLPKAREYGMVAMFAERLVYGRGFENLGRSIRDNLAPPSAISDNIIFDLARAGDNEAKDFAGRYIVPKALQDLPAREQYDDDTTIVAKWLGQLTGMSPKKIDYYLDGYTGIIGDTLQPLLMPSTYAVEGDEVSKILSPFRKKFVADNAYSSGASSSYYDGLDKLQQMINVEQKDMSTEEKKAYTSETEAFKKYINDSYGKDITDMGKILKDKSLSEAEKRQLRQYRNNAMKMANEEIKLFLSPKNR